MAKEDVYVASKSGHYPQHRKIAIPGKEQSVSTYSYQRDKIGVKSSENNTAFNATSELDQYKIM
jgi:hypothetical protein